MKSILCTLSAFMLTGCYNTYRVETKYIDPSKDLEITSSINGRASPGRIVNLHRKVLEFVNKEYLKK